MNFYSMMYRDMYRYTIFKRRISFVKLVGTTEVVPPRSHKIIPSIEKLKLYCGVKNGF